METTPINSGDQPILSEPTWETIEEERLTVVAKSADEYLRALHRKAGVMNAGTSYSILSAKEHSYIGNAIGASAHLIRYWLELESPKKTEMPPSEALTFTVEILKKMGVPMTEKTEEITDNKENFMRLLSRVAERRQGYTSSREPRMNMTAITCARELISLMPLLAASNEHSLPHDYSVNFSLHEIANHPEGPDFEELPFDTEGLRDVLKGLEPDSSGHIRLDETRRLQLEALLKQCGIAVNPPSKKDIDAGIEHATKIVNERKAKNILRIYHLRSQPQK